MKCVCVQKKHARARQEVSRFAKVSKGSWAVEACAEPGVVWATRYVEVCVTSQNVNGMD